MKENQGWREAYNKIIFEQVDINEETIPNFIQQEINKAVLEALQKRDEETLAKVKSLVMGYDTKDGYTQLYDQVIEHVYDQLLSNLTTK